MSAAFPGPPTSLHTDLTQLLMDNGAAVTKTSIDVLIKYIAGRDQAIIDKVIRDAEQSLAGLQDQTRATN